MKSDFLALKCFFFVFSECEPFRIKLEAMKDDLMDCSFKSTRRDKNAKFTRSLVG
jgi:hypothetical protein